MFEEGIHDDQAGFILGMQDWFSICNFSNTALFSPPLCCSWQIFYKYTTFLCVMANTLHTHCFIQLLPKSVKRKGEEIRSALSFIIT